MVSVRVTGAGRDGVAAATVRRRAHKMLAVLGLERAELSVLLCGDEDIRALNRDYRSKDRPTDVLAFAMREGREMPRAGTAELLGDVVISIETARRQARAGLLEEVTVLLAHGLLHLVGYDHRTDAEDRRMRARTDVLCRAAARREPAPQGRARGAAVGQSGRGGSARPARPRPT